MMRIMMTGNMAQNPLFLMSFDPINKTEHIIQT